MEQDIGIKSGPAEDSNGVRTHERLTLTRLFQKVRALSLEICTPLEAEDYVIQSMPEVSPPKWHLAHTTWFFEAFLLSRFKKDYLPFNPQFHFLFNSYYESMGNHLKRFNRGFLSRPGLPIILEYRKSVDEAVCSLIEACSHTQLEEMYRILTLGLNHEEQHQELLITDIKHNLCTNPTRPTYAKKTIHPQRSEQPRPLRWVEFKGGVVPIGAPAEGFAYDNERPRHDILLRNYQLASRLVTNGEFIEFIESGAYSEPDLWLSQGWDTLLSEGWKAPLYWEKQNNQWWTATLNGFEKVCENEPVCHVSYFEADAYARWTQARLPAEGEWETAAQTLSKAMLQAGNFLNSKALRPLPSKQESGLQQMFGDLWEWTASAYLPYPGFIPLKGPEGEYNGKFMSNQMVLRGGSCATPFGHIRASYRNFFPPHSRYQFMGIRLAKDLKNPKDP